MENIEKGALISNCLKYRYKLWRIWDRAKQPIMFMMLNPSTADAEIDDPTIRRCIGFAKAWGYGGIYVCNLFAYRSTDPSGLFKCDDPIGIDNYKHIHLTSLDCSLIVCAWGNSKIVDKLLSNLTSYKPLSAINDSRLRYLELSKDGTPKHPLYLKGDLKPKEYG